LARKSSTKLEATNSGASGVTISVPTAAIKVTLSRMAAFAASRVLPNRIAAAR
jgi:ABC-type glycerol-3-phosphate transport system permease component